MTYLDYYRSSHLTVEPNSILQPTIGGVRDVNLPRLIPTADKKRIKEIKCIFFSRIHLDCIKRILSYQAGGLHPRRRINSITEKAITGHFPSNNTCHRRARVKPFREKVL